MLKLRSLLSRSWLKVNQLWDSFEGWVASKIPGLKTKLTVALGLLGNTAFVLKDYMSGLSLDHYINTNSLLVANMILFTLAFWFRGMADRES